MTATVEPDSRASERGASADRRSPQDGDVVVTHHVETRVYYTVRQLPGIVQFSAGVRHNAVRLAREFAQQYRVDVWYSDAGTYRLLEVYRPYQSRLRVDDE
jgi:hypothetical protein